MCYTRTWCFHVFDGDYVWNCLCSIHVKSYPRLNYCYHNEIELWICNRIYKEWSKAQKLEFSLNFMETVLKIINEIWSKLLLLLCHNLLRSQTFLNLVTHKSFSQVISTFKPNNFFFLLAHRIHIIGWFFFFLWNIIWWRSTI